jgi:hypothetical protein
MIAQHAPMLLRRFLPFVLFALLSNVLPAQKGARFPQVTGETASGKRTTLPLEGTGRHTVLGLAMSRKAEPLLEEWFEPAYLRFVAKHGLFANAYQADVRFVPLFTGLDKAAYEPTLKKFRKSATPEVVDLVVFVKADLATIQDALGIKDKDVPWFFVLDDRGTVLNAVSGKFTDAKLQALEDVLLGD